MDSQPVSFLMLCRAEMNIILKLEIHNLRNLDFISKLTGVFFRTQNVKHGMTLSLVIRIRKLSESGSIWGPYTGTTDLKLDLLSFLTLVTKLLSHLAFCKIPPQHQREPRQKIYILFKTKKI